MTAATAKIAQDLAQQFCEAYRDKDLARTVGLFTNGATVIGSAIDERSVGLSELESNLRRDWSQCDQAEIRIRSFMPTSEDALWACADMETTITVDGEAHHFQHLRGTVVIENENGTWKIAHMHGSFPDFRNPDGSSFPINEA